MCGLRNDAIRQRLFAEEKLTFSKAVQIARISESAERDAHAVDLAGTRQNGAGHSEMEFSARSVNRIDQGCEACGDNRHRTQECKFRYYECSRCRQQGHLRRVCPEGWGTAYQSKLASSEAASNRRGYVGGSARSGGGSQQRGGRGGTRVIARGPWRGRGAQAPTYHIQDDENQAGLERAGQIRVTSSKKKRRWIFQFINYR